MCLGVVGRGLEDELDWNDEEYKNRKESNVTNSVVESQPFANLSEWTGENIISTQCTNVGGVIEWAFVPFIDEDNESQDSEDRESIEDEL